jgi:L-2-hydroxyglutarate oxidase
MTEQADVIVIGAGIVGLATAYRLGQTMPELCIVVLDKETTVGAHQTSHNSGVLHTGVYYRPGSLKAATCREGKRALEAFCAAEGIPYEICGKVIVATVDEEVPRLETIFERGRANGARCELIGREQLAELEPHAAGVRALHVPEAGIVDFRRVAERLAERIVERGAKVVLRAKVTALSAQRDTVVVTTNAGDFEARAVVSCAGLQADHVTSMSGAAPSAQIVPFRGEYYELCRDAQHLCKNLIYPVPDPDFPFLGVHFTRLVTGGVECGPNAVLAFAREGYGKTTLRIDELWESLTYPGFLRMAARHWRAGLDEAWRSLHKSAFVRALQRLVPEIRSEHLAPAPAGVRAQAVARDGTLVDDFLVQRSGRVINVENAPSPAATASLEIGKLVVERLNRVLA